MRVEIAELCPVAINNDDTPINFQIDSQKHTEIRRAENRVFFGFIDKELLNSSYDL